MQTAFQRENHRSFLMIREPEGEDRKQYSYRMILQNRIPGLLACSEHFQEEEAWLFYDISGKQSARNLCDKQTLKAVEMRRFLEALEQAFISCGNFLLDDRYLLLDPRYIYWDTAREEYGFVYYPGEVQKAEGFHVLADFFLDCAAQEEEQAVFFAYRFYQQTKKEYFSIRTFLEGEREKQEKELRKTAFALPALPEKPAATAFPRPAPENWEQTAETEPQMEGKKEKKIQRGKGRRGWRQELSKIWRKKGENKREEQEDAYARQIWEAYDRDPEEAKALWEEEERDRPEVTVFMGNAGRDPEDGSSRHSLAEMTESGKPGREFPLKEFPTLIGKRKGQVELLLEEPTVSRLHARVFLKEGKVALMDLNSTNGTFINGLRLEPEERVVLEPGDEIGFGEVKFRFV